MQSRILISPSRIRASRAEGHAESARPAERVTTVVCELDRLALQVGEGVQAAVTRCRSSVTSTISATLPPSVASLSKARLLLPARGGVPGPDPVDRAAVGDGQDPGGRAALAGSNRGAVRQTSSRTSWATSSDWAGSRSTCRTMPYTGPASSP